MNNNEANLPVAGEFICWIVAFGLISACLRALLEGRHAVGLFFVLIGGASLILARRLERKRGTPKKTLSMTAITIILALIGGSVEWLLIGTR